MNELHGGTRDDKVFWSDGTERGRSNFRMNGNPMTQVLSTSNGASNTPMVAGNSIVSQANFSATYLYDLQLYYEKKFLKSVHGMGPYTLTSLQCVSR